MYNASETAKSGRSVREISSKSVMAFSVQGETQDCPHTYMRGDETTSHFPYLHRGEASSWGNNETKADTAEIL